MTSEVNLEKSAPEGADKGNKPFLTINIRKVKVAALAFIFGAGITSLLMDDSEDIRRREWTDACVTTVGGASGKVGQMTSQGVYVAFSDGARVWYPMDELEKSECVELFPATPEAAAAVPEAASTSYSDIEKAAERNRDIMNARKELELLTLKLEQARLAREYYNTMQSEAEAGKR